MSVPEPIKIDTQVCIVGAGPAGTTASIFLSKYGIDHVMVERRSLPYDKVCGEGFVGRVIHVLNEIDGEWTKELFERNILAQSRTLRYFWHPIGKGISVEYPPSSTPFIKSKRREFDLELLLKAQEYPQLTYIDRCNIKSHIKNDDGVILLLRNDLDRISSCVSDIGCQEEFLDPIRIGL